jgi:uncharacterized protein
MKKKEIIAKIEEEAKKFFVGASGCHDWTHVERVRNLAMHIGKKEKADLFVLELAALLHDIGRKEEMKSKGSFCHAQEGAKTARKILEQYRVAEKQIENIVHCIETHRWRKNKTPETLEAKIIFDADKLDSIGAIGIARIFLFAGSSASGLLYTGNEKRIAGDGKDYSYGEDDTASLEYYKKLQFVHRKIVTKEGKRIAKERQMYMKEFFARFEKEIKGII